MEKLRHDLPDVLQRLFNMEILGFGEEELLDEATKALKEKLKLKSLLILATFATSRYSERFIELLNQSGNCKINLDDLIRIKQTPVKELLVTILNEKDPSLCNYESIIIGFVSHPSHFVTLLQLLLAEQRKDDNGTKENQLIQEILNVYSSYKSIQLKYWDLFNGVCNHYIANKVADPKFIIYLSEKLIERGYRSMLLRFYEYYLYLGEPIIYEHIFSVLIKSNTPEDEFKCPFTNPKDFFWLNTAFRFEVFKEKYERILRTKNSNEGVSDLIEENALGSLIAFCIYAKETTEVEIESAILWYATRRSGSKRLLDRMSEISGFEVPDEFKKTAPENRANWLSNRLGDAMKAFESSDPEKYRSSMKKLYAVQPFKTEVLRVLLKLDGSVQDVVVEKMLEYSIGRMTSYKALGNLLSYAITTRSQYGLRLVLRRLILLGYYDTIIFSLEKLQKHLLQTNLEQRILIGETLDSYEEFIPKNQVNLPKLATLKEWYLRFQQQAAVGRLFSLDEKDRIILEKEALDLLGKKEYRKLFKQLWQGKISSPAILELMLRSALALRNEKNVVQVYKELVEVDSAYASFYNLEVGPYFLRQKISWDLKKIGMNNLVSNVWGRPVVLEHPVNKLTLRIIGYPDDVKGPRKKKLRF